MKRSTFDLPRSAPTRRGRLVIATLGLVWILAACAARQPARYPFEPCAAPFDGKGPKTAADARAATLRPAFRECFLSGLERDASLQSCVVVRAEVSPSGRVERGFIDVVHGLDPRTAECIRSVIMQATFEDTVNGKLAIPVTLLQGRK